MSTVAVLGILWALFGVPLAVRVVQERRSAPMAEFQRAMGALQGPLPTPSGPPTTPVDTAARRRLVSTLTYAPGLALLLVGVLMGDTSVLAVALALVNLGTAHRLLGLTVDRGHPRPVGLEVLAHRTNGLSTNGSHAPNPIVDEPTGDAQTWGDGWKIIGPEPRRMDDLVLVDADLS